MKEAGDLFHLQDGELASLAKEISDLKHILRDVSEQISRIDRRLTAVLPSPAKPTKKNVRKPPETNDADSIVNRLTERAIEGEQIENELRRMKVKGELSVLAKTLGMTNTKLPPKHDLVRRISTRIRQRASLETSFNKSATVHRDITA